MTLTVYMYTVYSIIGSQHWQIYIAHSEYKQNYSTEFHFDFCLREKEEEECNKETFKAQCQAAKMKVVRFILIVYTISGNTNNN